MKNLRTYNIFLFTSTFTRNLVEVFSLVLLYKKGFSLNNLFLFLTIMYIFGIIVNYLSLKLHYKLVLIISSITYSLSFIYLSSIKISLISLSILAILLSIGTYSNHTIRHLLALTMLENNQRSSHKIIIITYIGTITASLIGTYTISKFPLIITSIIILILSLISIFPIIKQPNIILNKKNNNKVTISKDKIIFSILEQSKVIFIELQPVFLYIYINNSIYYVGLFNIITNIASLIIVYYFSKKITKKHFKYYTTILGLILILKLNIKNSPILLLIALLEGLFIKIYEQISLDNLYSVKTSNIKTYLLYEELIFFTTKSLILILILIIKPNFYIIMYLNILIIVISGFFIKEKETPSTYS